MQKNTDPDFPLQPPAGRYGRPETARQSYSIDAVNEFDPILDLMYDYCETMELDVDTLIHESGAAQLEVNFLHADPLSRADQVFLFKRTMREAAMRHGIYATFLAKPMENEPGSSMHIHQSLVDAKTGKNVFAGKKGERHSELFMHYLGGLQKYMPVAMAFFAPNVNSYRRLVYRRSVADECAVGLRQPHLRPARADGQPGKHARRKPFCRLRCQSVSGHGSDPGLRLAGHRGKAAADRTDRPVSTHAKGFRPAASTGRFAGMSCERSDSAGRECSASASARPTSAVKRKEYETFFRVISSWEREFLLLNVCNTRS